LPLPTNQSVETVNQEQIEKFNNGEKFNFSYVECLMFSFHILGRFHQEFLSSENNKERLKDFRLRLQYFAKGTQNYIKELKNSLKDISTINKENEEVFYFI
jgi:hypothetical protein